MKNAQWVSLHCQYAGSLIYIYLYSKCYNGLSLFLPARSQSLFQGKRNDEPISLVKVQLFIFIFHILYFMFYSHFMDVENNELKWKNALLLLMVYRYSYGLKNLLFS